jgi:hypothetical protein
MLRETKIVVAAKSEQSSPVAFQPWPFGMRNRAQVSM